MKLSSRLSAFPGADLGPKQNDLSKMIRSRQVAQRLKTAASKGNLCRSEDGTIARPHELPLCRATCDGLDRPRALCNCFVCSRSSVRRVRGGEPFGAFLDVRCGGGEEARGSARWSLEAHALLPSYILCTQLGCRTVGPLFLYTHPTCSHAHMGARGCGPVSSHPHV
jgi:hypothetical protein